MRGYEYLKKKDPKAIDPHNQKVKMLMYCKQDKESYTFKSCEPFE